MPTCDDDTHTCVPGTPLGTTRGDSTELATRLKDSTANSGVFLRCQDPGTITDTSCYEANIFDKASGWHVVNMHSSYMVADWLEFFVQVDNVFDNEYETFGLFAEVPELMPRIASPASHIDAAFLAHPVAFDGDPGHVAGSTRRLRRSTRASLCIRSSTRRRS